MRADRATAGPAYGRVRTRGQRVRRPRRPGRGERTAWGATPCWDGGIARRGHRGGASQQERPARQPVTRGRTGAAWRTDMTGKQVAMVTDAARGSNAAVVRRPAKDRWAVVTVDRCGFAG